MQTNSQSVQMPVPETQIAQGAAKAIGTLHQSATSLPAVVGAAVQHHEGLMRMRDKHMIDQVTDAHMQTVASHNRVMQLKPIIEEINQNMQEAKSLPDGDPTKVHKLRWLAQQHQLVTNEIVQAAQKGNMAMQNMQAIMSEPKARKILSKAVGYDPKNANSPERQMMIQSLREKQAQIQGQASEMGKAVAQTHHNDLVRALQGIGEVVGSIAAPGIMATIPGTPQHKMMMEQRALAMQGEEAKNAATMATAQKDEATARGVMPWTEKAKETAAALTEKKRESEATLAEKEAADKAKEAQAAATEKATEAYRQATLEMKKTQMDLANNPNYLPNKLKMEQVKAEQERAKAAVATAAQGEQGIQTLAHMVIKNQVAPQELPGFGKQRAQVLAAVHKIDPNYNAAQMDRAYHYANEPSTQNTLNYLQSLTGPDDKSGNLGIVIQMSNALPRGKYPPINNAKQWAKLQTGNPQIAQYYAAITESADQVAKIMQGGGTGSGTSDAKMRQALNLFNHGFTSAQMSSVASTLRELLANRKAAMIRSNPFLEQQFGAKAGKNAGPPSGADVQVPGPGGKLYWGDSKTHKIFGPVE